MLVEYVEGSTHYSDLVRVNIKFKDLYLFMCSSIRIFMFRRVKIP